MQRMLKGILAGLALAALISLPAAAALKVGDSAPDFTTRASLAGKEFDFHLAAALKNGPVVLYFFPKANTQGCDFEAHAFAEATARFKALGATIIGVSADNIATLNEYSVAKCRNAFTVAADPDQKVIKAYDTVLARAPQLADRTSYVIAPNGKVVYAYTDLNWEHHVENTLAAVQKWRDANPK
jgi:thioredoxin-dependent peroxiredoxin